MTFESPCCSPGAEIAERQCKGKRWPLGERCSRPRPNPWPSSLPFLCTCCCLLCMPGAASLGPGGQDNSPDNLGRPVAQDGEGERGWLRGAMRRRSTPPPPIKSKLPKLQPNSLCNKETLKEIPPEFKEQKYLDGSVQCCCSLPYNTALYYHTIQ